METNRRLSFVFDPARDVGNFINGTRSVNNPAPTKLQAEFMAVHGTAYDAPAVDAFLVDYRRRIGFDAEKAVAQVRESWNQAAAEFFARADRMFGRELPPVTAYLTTNQRCTYDLGGGYFFVNFASASPVRIVMHELLHFYTWHAFAGDPRTHAATPAAYNDAKESLTELLNLEFSDLMPGIRDEGYPQHAALRRGVREAWLATKDVGVVFFGALSQAGASK